MPRLIAAIQKLERDPDSRPSAQPQASAEEAKQDNKGLSGLLPLDQQQPDFAALVRAAAALGFRVSGVTFVPAIA